jgi:sulfite exporter TauE/SafE
VTGLSCFNAMMETISHLIALCRPEALGGIGVPGSLFVAGLAGSLAHCVGMCGPFVLGQVMTDLERGPGGYGEWRRLKGAALAPYHLGRLTTYAGLGALAGAVTGVFASTSVFGWLSGGLLVVGASLMVVQALGLTLGGNSPLAGVLMRLAAPLSMARGSAARYGLGVVLGFLPCGLLYGALAAAGGTGSAAEGAIAMAAFAVGTMPALVATGWGGLLVGRRLREKARWIAMPLLLGNAGLMLALASQHL